MSMMNRNFLRRRSAERIALLAGFVVLAGNSGAAWGQTPRPADNRQPGQQDSPLGSFPNCPPAQYFVCPNNRCFLNSEKKSDESVDTACGRKTGTAEMEFQKAHLEAIQAAFKPTDHPVKDFNGNEVHFSLYEGLLPEPLPSGVIEECRPKTYDGKRPADLQSQNKLYGTPGTCSSVRAHNENLSNSIAEKERKDNESREDSKKIAEVDTSGDCGTAAQAGYGGKCKAAKGWVETAKVTNAVSSMAGQTYANMQGQSAYNNAASQGTQSAALEGAADTMSSSGNVQMITGAGNLAMGYMQYRAANGLGNGIKALDTTKALTTETGAKCTAGNAVQINNKWQCVDAANNIVPGAQVLATGSINNNDIAAGKIVEAWKLEGKDKGTADRTIHSKAATAQGELSDMKAQVNQGMFASMMTGAQQMVMGIMNKKAAGEMKQAAAELRKSENNHLNIQPGDPLAPPTFGSGGGGDPLGARDPVALGGGDQAPASADPEAKPSPGMLAGDIPPAMSGDAPKDGIGAPAPGAFKLGDNTAGAQPGAGGAAGGGAVSTGASNDKQEEAQAKYAGNGNENVAYAGAGGGGYAPAGGGGSGGGAGAPPVNPLDMLAQMMKGGEKEGAEKTILDFGRGRGIASAGPESLLDRNANLFDRVHTQMTARHAKGGFVSQ